MEARTKPGLCQRITLVATAEIPSRWLVEPDCAASMAPVVVGRANAAQAGRFFSRAIDLEYSQRGL